MSLDMYSEKVADACALIREVSGGSEYFMVFDRHPESVLEFFVAAMAEVEKRATAKAVARIAELEREIRNMKLRTNMGAEDSEFSTSLRAALPMVLSDEQAWEIAVECEGLDSVGWQSKPALCFANAQDFGDCLRAIIAAREQA